MCRHWTWSERTREYWCGGRYPTCKRFKQAPSCCSKTRSLLTPQGHRGCSCCCISYPETACADRWGSFQVLSSMISEWVGEIKPTINTVTHALSLIKIIKIMKTAPFCINLPNFLFDFSILGTSSPCYCCSGHGIRVLGDLIFSQLHPKEQHFPVLNVIKGSVFHACISHVRKVSLHAYYCTVLPPQQLKNKKKLW